MTISLLFWILMVLWFFGGCYRSYTDRLALGEHLLVFVVIALLGWKVFGPLLSGG
jgi:hypothetical protein